MNRSSISNQTRFPSGTAATMRSPREIVNEQGSVRDEEDAPVSKVDNETRSRRTLLSGTDSRMDQPDQKPKIPPFEPFMEKCIYRDFSQSPPSFDSARRLLEGSYLQIHSQKFPTKLNAILSNDEFSRAISWMPHGRSWKIHNPHVFVEQVIPRFFKYTNYKSFIRLVNAWGFRRILNGPDRDTYYHELFLCGKPHLHSTMHRLTTNETKAPAPADPNFLKMDELYPLSPEAVRERISLAETEIALLHRQRNISFETNPRRGLPCRLPPADNHSAFMGALLGGLGQSCLPSSSPSSTFFGGSSSGLDLQSSLAGVRGGVGTGGLDGCALGLVPSALPAMNTIQQHHATLSAMHIRQSIELELQRTRQQEKLLRFATMRSTHPPPDGRLPGTRAFGTVFATHASPMFSMALRRRLARASLTPEPSPHGGRSPQPPPPP